MTEMPPQDGYRTRLAAGADRKRVTWIITDDLSAIDDLTCAIRAFSIVLMKSASDVIEACRIRPMRPHLVIADLDMRCTSGLILAALIRNHFPECKLWLLSEHAEGIRHALSRFSMLARAQIVRKPLRFMEMYRSEVSPFPARLLELPLADTRSNNICGY